MTLSVVIITYNEEMSLARTLESVKALVSGGKGEIIVVDSGSTDRTVEIAESYGARVFVEPWKGYAAQKNSAIEKATCDWILSLDAEEEIDAALREALTGLIDSLERIAALGMKSDVHPVMADDVRADLRTRVGVASAENLVGVYLERKNEFLGRWIRHGGFWPDPKLRFFRRGAGRFEDRAVHESLRVEGKTGRLRQGALLHHCYPTLSDYIDHMNRYSSLGAEMAVAKGQRGSTANIVLRPLATFIYNYLFRLGFLDGREGLLQHLYHAVYVSWKYAKVWELSHSPKRK